MHSLTSDATGDGLWDGSQAGQLDPAPVVVAPPLDDRGAVCAVEQIAPAAAIEREIEVVLQRPLSTDLQSWVDRYSSVGQRNPYLWKWCHCGVELTTLPSVADPLRSELYDTKVLGVMLDVLWDDVADRGGDPQLLEHLLSILYGPADQNQTGQNQAGQNQAGRFPGREDYIQLTTDVWQEIFRRVQQYPRYDEFADLLRFDYLQLVNAMRYSHLLNDNLALLNLVEHDLYLPHNMHMMISATIDAMCSPGLDPTELGLLRQAVWNAQYMGRIGNLVTTWQRELKEGDFTSGVFAHAVSQGAVSAEDLRVRDSIALEEVIARGDHESYFLRRWRFHHQQIQVLAGQLRSVDLRPLLQGLERLICLHIGSRGHK